MTLFLIDFIFNTCIPQGWMRHNLRIQPNCHYSLYDSAFNWFHFQYLSDTAKYLKRATDIFKEDMVLPFMTLSSSMASTLSVMIMFILCMYGYSYYFICFMFAIMTNKENDIIVQDKLMVVLQGYFIKCTAMISLNLYVIGLKASKSTQSIFITLHKNNIGWNASNPPIHLEIIACVCHMVDCKKNLAINLVTIWLSLNSFHLVLFQVQTRYIETRYSFTITF